MRNARRSMEARKASSASGSRTASPTASHGVIVASAAAGVVPSALTSLPAFGELLAGLIAHLLPLGVLLLRQRRRNRGDELLLDVAAFAQHLQLRAARGIVIELAGESLELRVAFRQRRFDACLLRAG